MLSAGYASLTRGLCMAVCGDVGLLFVAVELPAEVVVDGFFDDVGDI